jgi:hypothetical protein
MYHYWSHLSRPTLEITNRKSIFQKKTRKKNSLFLQEANAFNHKHNLINKIIRIDHSLHSLFSHRSQSAFQKLVLTTSSAVRINKSHTSSKIPAVTANLTKIRTEVSRKSLAQDQPISASISLQNRYWQISVHFGQSSTDTSCWFSNSYSSSFQG